MSQKNEVVLQDAENNEIKWPVICWKGKRIVTLQQVSELHKIPLGTIQREFLRYDKVRLLEGQHYFRFEGKKGREALLDANSDNLSELKTAFGAAVRWLRIGLTESGYLLLCKVLTDELSWYVQEQLINSYYRLKDVESKDPFDKIHSAIDEIKEMMVTRPAAPLLPVQRIDNIAADVDIMCEYTQAIDDSVIRCEKTLKETQKRLGGLAWSVNRIEKNGIKPNVKKMVESEMKGHMKKIKELEDFRDHIGSTVSLTIQRLFDNGCIQLPANSFVGKDHGTVPIVDKAMSDEEKKQLAERNKLVYQKFKDELRICKDLAGHLGINTVSGNEHAKFIAKLCRELHFKPGVELLVDRRRTDKKGKEYRVYILSDEGIDKILSWWEKNKEKGELGEDFYGNPCRIYKFGKSIYRIAAESTNAESAAG